MKNITKFIKNRDIFGYLTNFNFDKKEFTHKTTIGGIFTTFYLIFLLGYNIFIRGVLDL